MGPALGSDSKARGHIAGATQIPQHARTLFSCKCCSHLPSSAVGLAGIPHSILYVEILIWGGEGINTGRVSIVFWFYFFCVCGLVLPTLFLSQRKKTDVYFLLHGPELDCLLRKCQLTSILKFNIWHWILGAGGEEKEMRGTSEG